MTPEPHTGRASLMSGGDPMAQPDDAGMVVGTVTITRVLTDRDFRYDIEACDGEGNELDFDETLLIIGRGQYTVSLYQLAADLGIEVGGE
jgi:hypothetical protein